MEGPHGEAKDALQYVENGTLPHIRTKYQHGVSNVQRTGSGPYCYRAMNREGLITYANPDIANPQYPPSSLPTCSQRRNGCKNAKT